MGLLLARIIPLPFIVVNYTAGVSRSVKPWNYIWTSAVGGIPHYVAAALLFVGASRKYLILLVSGGIVLLVVWTLGYLFNSHVQRLKRWAH
ncbi:VTT domain-containing protein [Alicyclobacillus fastidiosus]|uniref:VTT domain-containing protein n=1 Tax=Alicyclobacillus fastidiosus TaxID=392011 RepID=UPI0034DD04AE